MSESVEQFRFLLFCFSFGGAGAGLRLGWAGLGWAGLVWALAGECWPGSAGLGLAGAGLVLAESFDRKFRLLLFFFGFDGQGLAKQDLRCRVEGLGFRV